MPADETAAAPFTDGTWLVSHNGRVDRSVLPASAAASAESTCDSAVLAAHVLERGVAGLAGTVTEVAAADPDARLSLLMSDGVRIMAVTWGDPLSYLRTPAGVVVASEPYDDDPAWVDVDDRHLVVATREGVEVAPVATLAGAAS